MIYLRLFLSFFKIGLFTFGGGYAMLPLIEKEVVANNWMRLEELVNFVAVSESTPGPFAVNVSTYVGRVVGGFFGAISATLGVVLPSFFIILLLAKCYDKFKESKIVKGCMSGLHPAVVGLIVAAAISIGKSVFPIGTMTVFFTSTMLVSIGIIAVAVFMLYKKLNPVWVICASGLIGIVSGYLLK
ncbi:chromate transporter [Anaerosporobacter sp.]